MHMTHAHHHNHSHAQSVSSENERKVLISFVMIFTFMVVEVAGGLLSGSLALLADAGHMLTDAAALGLAFAAFRFGRRGPDTRRTFGYMRFEVVAGLLNAITLFAVVIWILYEAWQRLQDPHEVMAGPMLAVAVAGLLVNLVVFRVLTRGDSEHVNIRGAVLHVLGDLLGSIAAIAAAVVIYLTGWTPIDAVLSVLVSLLVLRSAWGLFQQSLHILLEGAPANATPELIERHIQASVPGIGAISHIHVWSLTSGRVLATLHVRPKVYADARMVTRLVEDELRSRFDIEHSTIAIDWNEEAELCSLSAPGGTAAHAHAHAHSGDEHGRAQGHAKAEPAR
jgi:cobalt-zinc-cadmium efflux system protein